MTEIINREKITERLKQNQNILFAYLFGSHVKDKVRFGSDLDIALYFKPEPQLLEIGKIVNELENICEFKIDLVSLNNLYNKNPKLAYSIISEGDLLFGNNKKELVHFKRMTFLNYLDFKPVIDLFDRKLKERISNKKFAVVEK